MELWPEYGKRYKRYIDVVKGFSIKWNHEAYCFFVFFLRNHLYNKGKTKTVSRNMFNFCDKQSNPVGVNLKIAFLVVVAKEKEFILGREEVDQ